MAEHSMRKQTRKINDGPKIREEKATVKLMIQLYCRKKHGAEKNQLCPNCQQLLDYAMLRLSYCRFGEDKTTCRTCPVHCYRKDMRQKIQSVMRFSGPRMLLVAPRLAVKHLVKEIKK